MPNWIKEPGKPIPSETIVEAMNLYHEYVRSQAGFVPPVTNISFEDANPDIRAVKVHIDVQYKDTEFNMRSVEPDDAINVYKYLTNQPLVCAKYATKKTSTFEATQQRVKVLSDRFDPETAESKKGLFMHGGFVVSGENEEFLGMINTGTADAEGFTEIGVRFRADAWSHPPENLGTTGMIGIAPNEHLQRTYPGAGTVAVCALWDYTRKTKELNHKIKGVDIIGMRAVAMIDNPGGWKAQAKAGMIPRDVDVVEAYGPEIRFQTQKLMP